MTGLERRAFRLTILTISWNVVEALVAIAAGVAAGSVALKGFGLDSTIEVASAAIIMWKLVGKGGGVEREERARRAIAVTFVALAAWIGYESFEGLTSGREPLASRIGIILAAASLLAMPVLGFAKMRVGRLLKSRAIQADAIETFVCMWLSATLLAGLGLRSLLGWWWADYAGALLMVPFLLWQAWEMWEEE